MDLYLKRVGHGKHRGVALLDGRSEDIKKREGLQATDKAG